MSVVVDRTGVSIDSKFLEKYLVKFEQEVAKLSAAEAKKKRHALEEFKRIERDYPRSQRLTFREAWPAICLAYEFGLFDLIPKNGLPCLPINPGLDFLNPEVAWATKPQGCPVLPRQVKLRSEPTSLAGIPVDFPLALPASGMAVSSEWLEFFLDRGFCIVTLKTVRSRKWDAHPEPNWAFLKDGRQSDIVQTGQKVTAIPGYWPRDVERISLASSVGVPSLEPSRWLGDLHQARRFVKQGHQALIASVVGTGETFDDARADFAATAKLAWDTGVDAVELNLGAPTMDGEFPCDHYTRPADAGAIVSAVREALGGHARIFVKIGYLPYGRLAELMWAIAPYIDGVTGINSIVASAVDDHGKPTFAPRDRAHEPDRELCGVAGWAIRNQAFEVSKGLVDLRRRVFNDLDKRIAVMSVGGVLSKWQFYERLNVGVDAVGICTGAFLNPLIGLHVRAAEGAIIKAEAQESGGASGDASVRLTLPPLQGESIMDIDARFTNTADVALRFTERQDFEYAFELFVGEHPSKEVSMVEPNTLVVGREDLPWMESELNGVEYQVHPVRTFADLDPDKAAELRFSRRASVDLEDPEVRKAWLDKIRRSEG